MLRKIDIMYIPLLIDFGTYSLRASLQLRSFGCSASVLIRRKFSNDELTCGPFWEIRLAPKVPTEAKFAQALIVVQLLE
jgi:hypothetical protein